MSLWTPYVTDVALDLSKSAKRPLKEERIAPETSEYPSYAYQFSSTPFGFQCQYPVYVPSSQMSPVSGGSTCSYDAVPYTRPGGISPLQNLPRESSPVPAFPRPDSPPESPETKRRCSYMLDADTLADDPNYQLFERNALKVMAEKNGGSLLGNNPRMRRVVRSTNDNADDDYRRQRERNNFAAKQSRDRRKLREVKLALKVAYLKNEVASLRASLNGGVCSPCRTTYQH